MALTASMIRELTALGLTGEKLIECVTLFERYASQLDRDARDAKQKSAARSMRYRQRKRDGVTLPKRDASQKSDNNTNTSSFFLDDYQEKPKEVIKKERSKRRNLVPIPSDWMPKDSHYAWAKKNNLPDSFVLSTAENVRSWAESKDERRASWDQVLFIFMRNDLKKGGGNGKRFNGSSSSERGSGASFFAAMAGYRDHERGGAEAGSQFAGPTIELSAKTMAPNEDSETFG